MSCPMPPRAARGGTPRNVLTERQSDVLLFIAQHLEAKRYAPTTRDIASHFGWDSHTAAVCHLDALKTKHMVQWEPNVARSLHLTEAGAECVAQRRAAQKVEARHA
jgi:SOS-response transcriptional repressor LexA